MKKVALLVLGVCCVVSAAKKKAASTFLCNVDYVEIIDGSTTRVLFGSYPQRQSKALYLNTTYQLQNRNYTIGYDLVRLENFTIEENEANFDFYYGENLGFLCSTF